MQPTDLRAAVGRKQAIYFGAPGRTLFGFYHPPKEGPWREVGVVLCNPLGTDQTRSERTYRHTAERLSASGFACLRFDLYGTGDSAGDEFAPDLLRGWVDDVAAATAELRARTGAESIALIGLRFGGTLAMLQAARAGDVDALVLWNPCVSGAAYVGELTKLHKLYVRMEPQLGSASPPAIDGEEALGAFLPRRLVQDLSAIDLLRVDRRPATRALVIDGGNFAAKDALVSRLGELGTPPTVRSHPGHKFLVTVSHRAVVPDDVIAAIVDWLGEAHPKKGAAPVAPARPVDESDSGPHGERPIVFGEDHPLFGILTPAAPSATKTDRPMILLSNAGCVNRTGPHRSYVKMARRWAELGFDVFRVDLSGIGDSPAAPGTQENVPYPPSALDDLKQAAAASGDAARSIIIAGLCSGGDYAFQLGATGTRVAGALLLNPRTFCVLDLAAVESADGGAPPTTPVEEVPRTLEAMAKAGVSTLLVVSRNDPGVAYVDQHAGDAMGAMQRVAGFRRVNIESADHTFTPVSVQGAVSDLLTEHLIAQYR